MAAETYSITYTFVANETAVANQMNTNFNNILDAINAFNAANLTSGILPLARISGLTSTQMAAAFFKDEDAMTSDSATAVSSQQAIKAHVAAAFPDDDAFGTWATKANSTNYLAATDGFVVARSEETITALNGYTDSTSTPTTLIAREYDDAGGVVKGSICFPVKKGDYWKVTGATAIKWLPIGG